MPLNHRRGPCRFCTKPVGRKKGFATKSPTTGIWLVWHPRCDPNPPSREGGPKDAKFNRRPALPEEKRRERANYARIASAADAAVPSDFAPVRKPYYLDDDDE